METFVVECEKINIRGTGFRTWASNFSNNSKQSTLHQYTVPVTPFPQFSK